MNKSQQTIKVFKFGGASVRNAEAVRNAAEILKKYGKGHLILIISAMGKTTNALENIHEAVRHSDLNEAKSRAAELKRYHLEIVNSLFENNSHPVYARVDFLFDSLFKEIEATPELLYDQSYDRIVHYGEKIATNICAAYFNEIGILTELIDAREFIVTNSNFRDAVVDWTLTKDRIKPYCDKAFENVVDKVLLTQGFIAADLEGQTTTLGREGSDFSAAVFAFCADSKEMIIWKDVQGILNADPKIIYDASFLPHLSYRETVELAYYGATVIHPKTIKPLENKRIPLFVRSFINPELPATRIDNDSLDDASTPSFIFKFNQVLLSITPKDFSLINEKSLSEIFSVFSRNNVRIRLMQNSAVSFSICIDNDMVKLPSLIDQLQGNYFVRYNDNVDLMTIRHYREDSPSPFLVGKKILLEQKSRSTWQLITRKA